EAKASCLSRLLSARARARVPLVNGGGKSKFELIDQLKWAAGSLPVGTVPVSTTLSLMSCNATAWSTTQGFLEWVVLDQRDLPDMVSGRERRLRGGDRLCSA
ncbi:unnamed protein product, partial [Prorocentrum cordatum]